MRLNSALIGAIAVSLLITGCSLQSPETTPAAPAPPPAATGGAPGSAPGIGTGVVHRDSAAIDDQCADDDLEVAVNRAPENAGPDSYFFTIEFTNTGSVNCAMRGYPKVSVTRDGHSVGFAQTLDADSTVHTVVLAPNQTVAAPMQHVKVQKPGGTLDGKCTVVTADGFRIFAPHSRTVHNVPFSDLAACSNDVDWMTVGPVMGA